MPDSRLRRLALENSQIRSATSTTARGPPSTSISKKRKPSTAESRLHRSATRRSRADITGKSASRTTLSQKPSTADVAHMNSPVRIQWRHNKDDGSTDISFKDPDIWNFDEVEKDHLLRVAGNALNDIFAASDLDAGRKSRKEELRSRSELTEMGLKAVLDRWPTPAGYVLNELKESEDGTPSDFWLSRQDGRTTIGSLKPMSSAPTVYDLPDMNRDSAGNLDRNRLNQNFEEAETYLRERSENKPVDLGSRITEVEGTVSLISLLPGFNPLDFTAEKCKTLVALEEGVDAWCPNASAVHNC